MICKNCSQHVTADASFCPNCGAPLVNSIYERPSSKVNTYQAKRQGGYSKYIFVVSLILMIIFALNVFTTYSSLEDFQESVRLIAPSLSEIELASYQKMIGLIQGEAIFIFFIFALTLALLIVSSMLKNRLKRNEEPSINILKAQLIISIAAVALSVAYVIYEFIVIKRLNVIATELGTIETTSVLNLVGPIAIAALLIPCIFKSLNLLKQV